MQQIVNECRKLKTVITPVYHD